MAALTEKDLRGRWELLVLRACGGGEASEFRTRND
jgi:hypothetical protein